MVVLAAASSVYAGDDAPKALAQIGARGVVGNAGSGGPGAGRGNQPGGNGFGQPFNGGGQGGVTIALRIELKLDSSGTLNRQRREATASRPERSFYCE
jgi:hypothetical protein